MLTRSTESAVTFPDSLAELRVRLGARWPNITASRHRAAAMMERLRRELCHAHLVPHGTTLVVFGSLARGELTDGSDVDWTLLVDGAADADHPLHARRIQARLREMELTAPAAGGPFGSLTFSHDLIHRIGGDDDTNHNTTQRLLLLLESAPLGDRGAYDRVVRSVLARYVEEDLVSPGDTPYRVPRFLQNDVTRYWRTLAVDFAHKRRDRGARGWALRTAKLRMSRKLLYAAGLLSCFSCDSAFPGPRRAHPWHGAQEVVDHLMTLVRTAPLDIVAGVVLYYFGELSGAGERLLGAYDAFLGMLNDRDVRRHLDTLPPSQADTDAQYQRVRELGARFQDALNEIFFSAGTPLRDLTIRSGVF
ncbi:nucleotidyltransferase family protein [Longimicrobium sp.]|uniref:nucleotidyltransferase family protein n=1 Tax=Longimicrobium sp. TaxID=2029185 RepID=UPI002E315232|nr:nucleotidyltransferase domain-containing protein [Longimicrobium sp.]HEX6037149.1 nucleotidyltransferase domain-containing protein [Longimicrobium sp.]